MSVPDSIRGLAEERHACDGGTLSMMLCVFSMRLRATARAAGRWRGFV